MDKMVLFYAEFNYQSIFECNENETNGHNVLFILVPEKVAFERILSKYNILMDHFHYYYSSSITLICIHSAYIFHSIPIIPVSVIIIIIAFKNFVISQSLSLIHYPFVYPLQMQFIPPIMLI